MAQAEGREHSDNTAGANTAGAVDAFDTGPADLLFAQASLLEVALAAPLSTILKERSQDKRAYHPATLSYIEAGNFDNRGARVELVAGVRTRGNFRRDRSTCRFPPLQLNLARKQMGTTLENSTFKGQNKLKLVTHCRSSRKFDDLLLKEYLAYRIFNLVTNASFKVRLLRVSYHDTEGKVKDTTRYGFFIEPKKSLARRTGASIEKIARVNPADLESHQASLVEVFEYLIGNTDWSMLRGPAGEDCCHNLVLLRPRQQTLLPVPYDFDHAGLVNAPYAEPNEQLGIRSVRKRLFRGRCRKPDILAAALSVYSDTKADTMALVQEQQHLSERSRNTALKYLAAFYDVIEDTQRMRRELIDKCRG